MPNINCAQETFRIELTRRNCMQALEQKRSEIKMGLIERQDAIAENLTTATAIIDCVRVLTSLERMPSPPNSHDNGGGYANGDRVRDGSMALALYHAMNLISSAREASEDVFKQAIKKPTCLVMAKSAELAGDPA
jgi:hypothetical protein